MKKINAPEGFWYTPKSNKFLVRLFVKSLYINNDSDVDNFELWSDELRNEYSESHKRKNNHATKIFER